MKLFLWSRVGSILAFFLLLFASQLAQFRDLGSIALTGYDELFQLALGLKAFHGAWPGLDFFTNYGPGVAVLSALSWCWPNPILAETLTGALLASVGLLAFWLAGRSSGQPLFNSLLFIALVCAAPAWPKYYYLLWPGLFLLTLGDPCAVHPPRVQRLRCLLLGLIIGLGGWFRLEIGLALAAALAGALFVHRRALPSSNPRGCAGWIVAGGLAPWLAYFGSAWMMRGRPEGPLNLLDFFVASTLAKTGDFRSVDGVPDAVDFFSQESMSGCLGLALAFGIVLILLRGLPHIGAPASSSRPLARRAWCAAWLMLCLSPQALHRVDCGHTQEVLGPGLIAVVLGLADWLQFRDISQPNGFVSWRRLVALTTFCLLVSLCGIIQGQIAPPPSQTLARLSSLAAGLAGLDSSTPDLVLTDRLRTLTKDTDTILVPSLDSRLYVLTGRSFAGLFPHWAYSLPTRWTDRQIAALRAHPPALVAHADYFRNTSSHPALRLLDFYGRNPALDAYVKENYPNTVYQTRHWRILAPVFSP